MPLHLRRLAPIGLLALGLGLAHAEDAPDGRALLDTVARTYRGLTSFYFAGRISARMTKQGHKLEVTLRVHGFGSQLWRGHVGHLPKLADKTVPIQLTSKGGGPLAMKPGSDPKNPEPQGQVYLVGIDFETPDRAIVPGSIGQVKIHCEYRSCAWWTWRTLSSTFDLGLW